MIRFLRLLVNIYMSVFYRLEVRGLANIPAKGSAIICPNHVGQLDMFYIGCRTKRLIHYMAKEELFRNPLMAAIIRYLGAFPVKRSFADEATFNTVFKLLHEGHLVGIFPEGTRMRGKTRGSVKLKAGAAMFAHGANVPVIPVGISGDFKLFGKIRINIGEPFMLPETKADKPSKEELREMTENIMNRVYVLMEEK